MKIQISRLSENEKASVKGMIPKVPSCRSDESDVHHLDLKSIRIFQSKKTKTLSNNFQFDRKQRRS